MRKDQQDWGCPCPGGLLVGQCAHCKGPRPSRFALALVLTLALALALALALTGRC